MIKDLELVNFRNYQQKKISLDKLTIFVGPNGIGKTNILEAIFFLSTTKSFRANSDKEMILWNADFCRVKIDDQEIIFTIAPKTSKQAKINQAPRTLKNFLGSVKTVLFTPDSLRIVNGTPSERRKFLNLVLLIDDVFYRQALIDLTRILKNRNSLLERIKNGLAKAEELDFWDEKFIEVGLLISQKRAKLIAYFNQKINQTYQKISAKKEKIEIIYYPTDYSQQKNIRGREIAAGLTLLGPQREDFAIFINNRPAAAFASRGEIRSLILALKICELEYLKQKSQDIVLLLDDVFSELDVNHRQHLGKLIGQYQTLITTTDLDHIGAELKKKAKIMGL